MDWAKTTARQDEAHSSFGIGASYIGDTQYIHIGSCNGLVPNRMYFQFRTWSPILCQATTKTNVEFSMRPNTPINKRHSNCSCFHQPISPWRKWLPFWQTTFSNEFSWMKMVELQFKFHVNLFPGVQLTKNQHWFIYWLGAKQAKSHYLNQWWPTSLTHICSTRGK